MKKLLMAVVMAIPISGIAHGQQGPNPPIIDPVEGMVDRVQGIYALECRGYRIDTPAGAVDDWILRKDYMDYLVYGVASHTVIDALNKMYLGQGDAAGKATGTMPDGIPVPGVNR